MIGAPYDLHKLIQQSVVLDLETSIVKTENGFSPMPWHGAYIVASNYQWNIFDDIKVPASYSQYDKNPSTGPRNIEKDLKQLLWSCTEKEPRKLLVGHNLKFDLGHIIYAMLLHGYQLHVLDYVSNLMIWDTMLAEYYLSGQELTSPGLEFCCGNYGIPFVKDTTVSESFKLGLGADKIDKDTLCSYLYEDVTSTMLLYKAQLRRALAIGGPAYVDYLLQVMGASVATCISEINGINVDMQLFSRQELELRKEVDALELKLNDFLTTQFSPLVLLYIV